MRARPIQRSDGELYESATEAAHALVDECGCGNWKTVTAAITNVANKRPHYKTAYGYGWKWVNEKEHQTEAEAIAAWNSRADYHGYEQAAIEAWESVKAWNSRAERTCQNVDDHKTVWFICSVCGNQQKLSHTRSYCPHCGCKVVGE